MELLEKTLSHQVVYEGRVLRLEVDKIRLPNGGEAVREVARHPGGVCVLALTPAGEVLFVRQYRYPYGKEILELPAGKLEPGEEPMAAALRELEEETGYTSDILHPLGTVYPSPGCMDEVLHLFLAGELKKTAQNLDEDEFLQVEAIPLQKALAMVAGDALPDAKTQVALLRYRLQF